MKIPSVSRAPSGVRMTRATRFVIDAINFSALTAVNFGSLRRAST